MLVRFNENFGGRNNYVNVDENRKNFGLLIFDPNRTPIQMCLSLARKSRETGHPKGRRTINASFTSVQNVRSILV